MTDRSDLHRRDQVNQIKSQIANDGRESAGKSHNQYSPEWKQANVELGQQRSAARKRYLEQVKQAQRSEERARTHQQAEGSSKADPRKEEARRQAAQMTKQVKAREASQTAAQGQGM